MFYIFSLVSTFLCTSFQGNSSQCNNIDSPCNYSAVQQQMDFGDTIIIMDSDISEPAHLEAFHNLSSNALLCGVSLQGMNTSINGSLSNYFSPSFIICQGHSNASIEFFKFINFAFPIIYCDNCTNIKISFCDFTNNHVDSKLAILIFENFCSVTFSHTNFSFLTSHDSSIISSCLSIITFDYCTIDKSFLFHSSRNISLIMIIQSSFQILNSNFIQNQSPYSPFFILKNSSSILIENSSFSSNQNTFILYCKEVKNIMIKNSFFYNNMGNFLTNIKPNIEINILKTHFEQNYSPRYPFFNIIYSTVNFNDHCTFNSNSAHSSLFQFIGSKSIINETQFSDNHLDDSIIKYLNKSEAIIYSCKFSNSQSKKSVIMGVKSKIIINKSIFYKSWSTSILASFCELHIFNSIFDQSESHGKLSISSLNSTNSEIFDSSFKDRSLSHLIKLNGSFSLKNLDFNTNKEFALSKKLLKNCKNCTFVEDDIKDDDDLVSNTSFFLMIFLSFIVFALILIIFRKRFSYFWRKCINKKIKD